MPTTEELLDLAAVVGQRSSTVRWDVLDKDLVLIGTVHPDAGSPPTVALSTTRSIMRDLSGLQLSPSEQAGLDPFGDRLRPTWVLENGAEFPLGVFVFGSFDRLREEYGVDAQASCVDQTIIVDQPITDTVALDTGDDIRSAIEQQLAISQVPSWDVDADIGSKVGAPILWNVGTSRLKVINDLAAMVGAWSLYFDNNGVGRVELVTDLSTGLPDHVYESGGNLNVGSMVESDDLLGAPNRFFVIDTSSTDYPITGQFDVPDSAPNSEVNRGFYVVEVIQEQGLVSSAEADARARAAYAQSSGIYEWVKFSSAPDPRHDTFDSVQYLGQRYWELGWSLPLAEGAPMTHGLRRVYS